MEDTPPETPAPAGVEPAAVPKADLPADADPTAAETVEELGGPAGPDPTRFGDWERKGRCIDF